MDYAALRSLIETHPTHGATSDADMVTWLTDATAVTRNQTTLSAETVRDIVLTDTTEWLALTEPGRATINMILGVGGAIPVEVGTPTRDAMQDILGTNTKAALGAALPEDVSRLDDAGLGQTVAEGQVAYARTF
jgi:hypothetical protein